MKLLAPFLWPSEEILEVVEITTDPGVARRTGVLAVTSQRVLVLNELRRGSGLKTTLRTYSFRHRSLEVAEVVEGALRLRSKEQQLSATVAAEDPDAGAAEAERIAACIQEQRLA
jgi:hypothetical protein